MGATINISLTSSQVALVNQLVKRLGFANRSELFRALIRWISQQPKVIEEITTWPFQQSPATRDRKKILTAFKRTGIYSRKFLADLEEGLKNSDYFD